MNQPLFSQLAERNSQYAAAGKATHGILYICYGCEQKIFLSQAAIGPEPAYQMIESQGWKYIRRHWLCGDCRLRNPHMELYDD